MHSFRPISYRRLPSEESSKHLPKECLLVEDDNSTISTDLEGCNDQTSCWELSVQWLRVKEAVIAIVFAALLIISFLIGSSRSENLQSCLEKTSSNSPALEAVRYYETDFANAFDQKSRYRGPPTPALEKAWEGLWNQSEFLITPDAMSKLGRSDKLDNYLKAPQEEGDGYVGGLEVFHQLHCLSYIRQFTWYMMDKYNNETLPPGFDLSLKELRMHTDHCIETLRLVLMCRSDVSPVLVRWSFTNPPVPEAEFSSHHRCRSFEDVFAWNLQHGLKSWGIDKSAKHS